jgi:hypothetical protein
MKADAKDAFEQALDEELYVEVVRGKMVVGNRRGLNLAGLSTRVRALEDGSPRRKRRSPRTSLRSLSLKTKCSL